jgi:monoamine oxidase
MTDAELGFTKSLWSATAEAAPLSAALVGDVSADVVIVGAGFTGLSAALHLAEAGQSVGCCGIQSHRLGRFGA